MLAKCWHCWQRASSRVYCDFVYDVILLVYESIYSWNYWLSGLRVHWFTRPKILGYLVVWGHKPIHLRSTSFPAHRVFRSMWSPKSRAHSFMKHESIHCPPLSACGLQSLEPIYSQITSLSTVPLYQDRFFRYLHGGGRLLEILI